MSLLLILMLAACTPGAQSAGTGSAAAATTTIDVSLTSSTATATAYGSAGGFSPLVTTVPLGSTVRFVNTDSFSHTATSVGGAAFPASSPLGAGALGAFGGRLSAGWSTGTLAAGTASPPLLADVAGTYLYGCFFHYGAPMRAAIVVR
jgi:plastocyanin